MHDEAETGTAGLSALRFENSFLKALPGDTERRSKTRHTPGVAYALIDPTPVPAPSILAWSDEAGELLDLQRPQDRHGLEAQVFAGNRLLPGMESYATRYGGHQFGNWAGQLGDGRAILLGEIRNRQGQLWEIQLKGAGPTPYSRRADGRAVLRSSLREYLCSEAMFHLGVPTTRALCCVTTGDSVVRDMFYDGNPEAEPGAITTRLAPSFLRFGHFEILAAHGEVDNLRALLDYAMRTHFPELPPGDYQAWFEEVAARTAVLMVHWLRVGFVHGVMNTDNMSILGLTIDYGPYGWLDVYDPSWTPNTTDAAERRYRFAQQPAIAHWNLTRLAEAISPLFPDTKGLEHGLDVFRQVFAREYEQMMQQKLGLSTWNGEDDRQFLQQLDAALRKNETDMTLFYRALAAVHALAPEADVLTPAIRDALYAPDTADTSLLETWLKRYRERVAAEGRDLAQIQADMQRQNPYFILRNYLVQEALDALEKNDRSVLDALQLALKTPYEENAATARFTGKRPEWARTKAGCSALSCSS